MKGEQAFEANALQRWNDEQEQVVNHTEGCLGNYDYRDCDCGANPRQPTNEELAERKFPSLLQSAEDERRQELNLILNHDDIEDARINARLDAQAEYENRDDGQRQ